MARYLFGGGAADWLYVVDEDGKLTLPDAGTPITFWTDVVVGAGSQYSAAPSADATTGLLDPTGAPIDHVGADANGRLPARSVQGPDDVTRMAMDASGGNGPRAWVYPDDPVALSVAAAQLAAQAQATADAALAAAGGGTAGTVTRVAGVAPDGTGNVPLTAGAVGALTAGPGNSVALAKNDQFLVIVATDEDNSTTPNRVELHFIDPATGEDTVVQWDNEYWEKRLRAARDTTTPFKVTAHSATQSANLAQWEDYLRNPLSGVRADGTLFAPNIGNAKFSAQTTAPPSPRKGDAWSDTSQNPPAFKLYDGSVWVVPSAAGGGTPPASAPAFQSKTEQITGGTSHTATKPATGATLVAVLAWNGTGAATPPAGWTLVDEITTTSGRAGVWIADGAVTTLTWTFATSLNVSSVVLGYEACSVLAHAGLSDTGGDAVHTAPDLTVGTVPATVLRAWFDKTAVSTTAQTPSVPAGHTQRALEAPTSGTKCTILAADKIVSAAGAAGTADSTYTLTANNAGGFTVALVKA